MKKYLLVSLTALFAVAFLWAQDAATTEPKVDIEADATVSWGVDLGSGKTIKAKHGFNNDASWKVKFPLLKKANYISTQSDVPVYGEIVLKDMELNILSDSGKEGGKFGINGKVAGIEAKFVFYGAYITAHDKPSFKSNFANLWDPLEKNKKFDADDDTFKFEPGFDGYGFKLGYANKDFMDLDVGLKFGSNGNWDSGVTAGDTKNKYTIKYFDGNTKLGDNDYILMSVSGAPKWVNGKDPVWGGKAAYPKKGSYPFYKTTKAKDNHSQYGIGLDFSMKPLDKLLGVAFTVNSTFTASKNYKEGVAGVKDDTVALGLGAEVTSEPIDGLKLKLGFDGGMNFETQYHEDKRPFSPKINTFAWDMLFDAGYKWVNAGMYVSSPGTGFSGENGQAKSLDNAEITDLSLYAKFATKGDTKEASNLLEGLDAGVYFGFHHLITFAKRAKGSNLQFPLVMKVWGAYKLSLNDSMWIKPYVNFWANTNHSYKGKNPNVGLAYDLGVTFSPAEKVELNAAWEHGELTKNKLEKFISDSALEHQHNGRFVLSLKVAY